MESATITKVTLRKEKLRSGKLSLYLDYYPPIWNPHIKKMSRREFLGLYLIGNPKDKFELEYNEEIMLKARGIRATRELAIINEEFGFLDRTKKQADFLEYFENKTKEKYQKWEIVYKHFKDFCNGRCLMKDVTIGLCNDFRTYILKIRVKQSGNTYNVTLPPDIGQPSAFYLNWRIRKAGSARMSMTTLTASTGRSRRSTTSKSRKSNALPPLPVKWMC